MYGRKKIVWLCSWYPNRTNQFDGDFIQRHAKAAAIHNDIHVIVVKASDQHLPVEIIENKYTGLTETIVYFRNPKGLFANRFRQLKWFKLFKKAIQSNITLNGRPDLVHVHIPWKAGLLALWVKKKYGIQYMVSEHWGIYNETVSDNYHLLPSLNKMLIKQVFEESKSFTSVSYFLAKAICKNVSVKTFKVIPNVVDTTLFYPKSENRFVFRFIHVSNMVPLKNVDGILEAFGQFLKECDREVQLIMVGNPDSKYIEKAGKAGLLNKYVFFKGEVGYRDVAELMQESDCLVMNSEIENAPCVISEALCCGLPVIATRVGGIPEMINESNGILIDPITGSLKEAMLQVVDNINQYNKERISSDGHKKYGYGRISEEFSELYGQTDIVKDPI